MKTIQSKMIIDFDIPLNRIEEDSLNFSGLAKNIAEFIIHNSSKESYTIAINGRWGSGKTSIINFIKEEINKYNLGIKILDFDPWLFSGHTNLISEYFQDLSSVLRKSSKKTIISKTVLKYALKLAGDLAPGKITDDIIENYTKEPSLSKQKEKIRKILQKESTKILIIIDNIDRLDPEEILNIFKMVKSVADFPNLIYLLSYDKRIVIPAINHQYKLNGEEYLEKIIQLTFDVPNADPTNLLNLMNNKIKPLLQRNSYIGWDEDRWKMAYHDYLYEELRTPRQIIRIANAFKWRYENFSNSINSTDLLLIEAIKVFNPKLYEVIRTKKIFFTSHIKIFKDFDDSKEPRDNLEKIIKSIISNQDRRSIELILCNLFPKIKTILQGFKETEVEISRWDYDKRICSRYHFNKYFNINLNDHSDDFFKELFNHTISKENFTKKLAEISEQSVFFDRLFSQIKTGKTLRNNESIMLSLITDSNQFLVKDSESYNTKDPDLTLDSMTWIIWIIIEIMHQLSAEKIYPILESSFEKSSSIEVPLEILFYLSYEHGKYFSDRTPRKLREDKREFLNYNQFASLEKIIHKKIQDFADNDSLLNERGLGQLLYRWKEITGNFEEPRQWVKKISFDRKKTIKLLETFIIKNYADTSKKRLERFKKVDIENFFTLENLFRNIAQFLDNPSIPNEEKEILQNYQELLSKMDIVEE